MSLFRGLNEAPTTKGGPACSRTACPPAPDAHNSFIQEPHVHTKAPPKSIRHPATLDNASNLLRIEGSNEGTAFRGDQTSSLPLKTSKKSSAEEAGEEAACWVAELVPALQDTGSLPPPGPSARHSLARATAPLGLWLCAALARVNLCRPLFPVAPGTARTVAAHTCKYPARGSGLAC